jgi:hypothetical protein
MGTLERITRSLQAANRENVSAYGRFGVLMRLGLCDQMGPMGLMRLTHKSHESRKSHPRSVPARLGLPGDHSAHTVSPATIVRTARPFRFQPSKGVLRERDNDSSFL